MSPWILLQLVVVLLASVSSGRAGASECQKPVLEGNMVLSNEAILKNDFPDGSDVTLKCANGYVVDLGSDRITCTDGKWSEPDLRCKKKDCGTPRPVPNLNYDMSFGTLFGAHIKPFCDRGYYLEGSSYRQCLATGWSGRVKCKLITCETPPSIPNGMSTVLLEKKEVEFEDIIEYSCNPGYTLKGNRTISCQEDGDYSPPPQCVAIECQAPQIEFGDQIKGESRYTYKSEAIFQCHPGYTMKGSPRAVCEEYGWSELPVCIQGIPTTEYDLRTTDTTTTFIRISTSTAQPDLQGIPRAENDLRTTDTTTTSIRISTSTVQPDLQETDLNHNSSTKVCGYTLGVILCAVILGFLVFGLYRYSRRKGMRNRTAPAF